MRKMYLMMAALLLAAFSYPHTTHASLELIMPAGNKTVAGTPEPAAISKALEEFKNLSRKEKKERFKEIKKEIRKYKAAKKAGSDVDTNTLLLVILALLLPPLAVYLHQGEANTKFWITLILFLGGIAGIFIFGWYLWLASVIYALVVVLANV